MRRCYLCDAQVSESTYRYAGPTNSAERWIKEASGLPAVCERCKEEHLTQNEGWGVFECSTR